MMVILDEIVCKYFFVALNVIIVIDIFLSLS